MTRFALGLLILAESCLSACAPVKVGPFVPAGAKSCAADPDCKVGYACRFPHVDSRAVCVQARPGYDDVMDSMPNEPAQ
jgi:hypothetical protein